MQFDFNRFRLQLDMMIDHWPSQGEPPIPLQDARRLRGLIHSMTSDERRDSDLLLDRTRQERVAKGAGVSAADVGEFLAQFQGLAIMCRRMSGERQ